jgi:ribosome biogenesis GTPase
MDLEILGWNDFYKSHYGSYNNKACIPARIARVHRNLFIVLSERGQMEAQIAGKLRHDTYYKSGLPVIGDWVVIKVPHKSDRAIIKTILPRKSSFSRKAVTVGAKKSSGGRTEEQVLAANVDFVFLISGLDNDFNIRRIERYVTASWDSGASPVVILNKVDLCVNPEDKIDEVQNAVFGVPVHTISAADGTGIEALDQYLKRGITISLLGSSGVGKSSIINRLYDEEILKVGALRKSDGRGRHTTTWREMILMPQGCIIIDTPGIRELQLWADEESLKETFDDIEALAAQCRFNDCKHESEPGCAIIAAMEDGSLDKARFKNYLKLQREILHMAVRKDYRARMDRTNKWKQIEKMRRQRKKVFKKNSFRQKQ